MQQIQLVQRIYPSLKKVCFNISFFFRLHTILPSVFITNVQPHPEQPISDVI